MGTQSDMLGYLKVLYSCFRQRRKKDVPLNEYSSVWRLSALQVCLDAMNLFFRCYLHGRREPSSLQGDKRQLNRGIVLKPRHATRFCKTGQNCTNRGILCARIYVDSKLIGWFLSKRSCSLQVVVTVNSIIESPPYSQPWIEYLNSRWKGCVNKKILILSFREKIF